ncbi:hypothetical protein D3C80_863540 [compost metagenome]
MLVDHLMNLLTIHRRIEGFAVLRLEPGHYCERCFLLEFGGSGAAVGAQLIYLAAESNHFAVQLIERAQTKITVCQQPGDGGLPFVHAAQQSAH